MSVWLLLIFVFAPLILLRVVFRINLLSRDEVAEAKLLSKFRGGVFWSCVAGGCSGLGVLFFMTQNTIPLLMLSIKYPVTGRFQSLFVPGLKVTDLSALLLVAVYLVCGFLAVIPKKSVPWEEESRGVSSASQLQFWGVAVQFALLPILLLATDLFQVLLVWELVFFGQVLIRLSGGRPFRPIGLVPLLADTIALFQGLFLVLICRNSYLPLFDHPERIQVAFRLSSSQLDWIIISFVMALLVRFGFIFLSTQNKETRGSRESIFLEQMTLVLQSAFLFGMLIQIKPLLRLSAVAGQVLFQFSMVGAVLMLWFLYSHFVNKRRMQFRLENLIAGWFVLLSMALFASAFPGVDRGALLALILGMAVFPAFAFLKKDALNKEVLKEKPDWNFALKPLQFFGFAAAFVMLRKIPHGVAWLAGAFDYHIAYSVFIDSPRQIWNWLRAELFQVVRSSAQFQAVLSVVAVVVFLFVLVLN